MKTTPSMGFRFEMKRIICIKCHWFLVDKQDVQKGEGFANTACPANPWRWMDTVRKRRWCLVMTLDELEEATKRDPRTQRNMTPVSETAGGR